MSKPTLAIVGRPNVGKSTLFNRLIGRQAAIVQDMPGVTRDRHYGEGSVLGWDFIAVDTGGFEPESSEGMLGAMREQAEIAITEADAVIAVYDGPAGLTPVDREIVRILARTNKPVFHVVNKIDCPKHDAMVAEFWETGVSMLYPISAQHGGGVLDLMEEVIEAFPESEDAEGEEDSSVTRIAVIGKPNAGKSTLVNRMLGEDRLLVSDVPGTTRDAIDTWLERPADPSATERAQARLDSAIARLDESREEAAPDEEEGDDDERHAHLKERTHRSIELGPRGPPPLVRDAGDRGRLPLVADEDVHIGEELEEAGAPLARRVGLRHDRDCRATLDLGALHQPRHGWLERGAIKVRREVEVRGARREQRALVNVGGAQLADAALVRDERAVALAAQADAHALRPSALRRQRDARLADLLLDEVAVEVGADARVQHAAAERVGLRALPPRAQQRRELHRRVQRRDH